ATTDPDKISQWWGKHPDSNVGIATGTPGPDVLDIDNHGERGTGMPGYAKLKAAGLTEGYSAMIRTPHNGIHLYYRGSQQRNGKLRDQHIDYRGQGGYVAAPPSTVDGHAYEVFTHHDSTKQFDWNAAKTLLMPDPARPARPVTPPGGSLDHLVGYVSGLPEGNRNDGLFWAGCRAAEAGDEQVMGALADAAAHTGLNDHEIARTLESARKTAGRREPRPFREHSPQKEAG
ncbi:MAG: bifunctional DNA primase/polymerase, partial [Streptosporangiaceae bacterium]